MYLIGVSFEWRDSLRWERGSCSDLEFGTNLGAT